MDFWENSREVKCCFCHSVSRATWYPCDITDDVNLYHLANVVFARSFYGILNSFWSAITYIRLSFPCLPTVWNAFHLYLLQMSYSEISFLTIQAKAVCDISLLCFLHSIYHCLKLSCVFVYLVYCLLIIPHPLKQEHKLQENRIFVGLFTSVHLASSTGLAYAKCSITVFWINVKERKIQD